MDRVSSANPAPQTRFKDAAYLRAALMWVLIPQRPVRTRDAPQVLACCSRSDRTDDSKNMRSPSRRAGLRYGSCAAVIGLRGAIDATRGGAGSRRRVTLENPNEESVMLGHVLLPGGKACPATSFLIWCWAAAASKAKSTQTRDNTHFQNRTVMLHAGERQTKAGVLCVGGGRQAPARRAPVSH